MDSMTEIKRLPKDQRPTVRDVTAIAKAYYAHPSNSVGGNLHIVLEEWNIETKHVEHCKQQAIESGDAAGVELADLLLQMSKTQRRKVAAQCQ